MKDHRKAFAKTHQQTLFRSLDLEAGLRNERVKKRQGNRFNSMLQECYGGRKAIRTFLKTGKLKNIRVPPLHRLNVSTGARRPEPNPAPNPKAARKRARYYDALIVDMQAADGEPLPEPRTTKWWAPWPEHRTTKYWAPFVEGVVKCEPVQHRHYARAADGINAALAKQWSREHGVSARSR